MARPDDPLAPLLGAQDVVILDGGLGTELALRGHDLSDVLWSARLLRDAPEAIRQVHWDYLEAGADVITTASYQVSYAGFAALGVGRAGVDALLAQSVALAREARDAWWAAFSARAPGGFREPRQRPLVAASVGPWGAARGDGAEYRGGYGLSVEALADWHRPRLAALADAGADLLACETLPGPEEADALARVLAERPHCRAWMSFACQDDTRLAQGEPFASVAARIAALPQVVAVGVNCTAPRHVAALLAGAAVQTSRPLLAYPNRGDRWDAEARVWRPGPGGEAVDLVERAPAWRAAGARLIGGCCGIRPADIRRLRLGLLGPGVPGQRPPAGAPPREAP